MPGQPPKPSYNFRAKHTTDYWLLSPPSYAMKRKSKNKKSNSALITTPPIPQAQLAGSSDSTAMINSEIHPNNMLENQLTQVKSQLAELLALREALITRSLTSGCWIFNIMEENCLLKATVNEYGKELDIAEQRLATKASIKEDSTPLSLMDPPIKDPCEELDEDNHLRFGHF